MANLSVSTLGGRNVIKVLDGHVKYFVEDPLRYDRRPGRFRLTAPVDSDFLQPWALDQVRQHEPDYANQERLTVLDVEVVEPGLVRVQGIWPHDVHPVVVTQEHLMFLDRGREAPKSLAGEGADSVWFYDGPITTTLFGFSYMEQSPSKARAPRKVGRNDPCPCGSGKKYKKSCGNPVSSR